MLRVLRKAGFNFLITGGYGPFYLRLTNGTSYMRDLIQALHAMIAQAEYTTFDGLPDYRRPNPMADVRVLHWCSLCGSHRNPITGVHGIHCPVPGAKAILANYTTDTNGGSAGIVTGKDIR